MTDYTHSGSHFRDYLCHVYNLPNVPNSLEDEVTFFYLECD